MPLSLRAIESAASQFNGLYRARRLAAVRRGEPFPSVNEAKRQLLEEMLAAEAKGEVDGINEFWGRVFRPPASPKRRAFADVVRRPRRERRQAPPLSTRPRPAACEACERGDVRLSIDHVGGEFRGWLCMECSAVLGLVASPAILRRLAEYAEVFAAGRESVAVQGGS